MFSQILLITVAVIVVSAKSIDEASLEETETERIIGGKDASPGQYPWAAALFFKSSGKGQFICTSSIISPTAVMTAAHCVQLNGEFQPADRFYAIANINKSFEGVRIDFANVTVHPEYNNQSIDNDIAIFKTTQPITLSDEVQPICIARPDTSMREYKNGTVMGWGNRSPFRVYRNIPDILQYACQKIVRNSLCSFLYPRGVDEKKMCSTGFLAGVCHGDSGGPLVSQSKDKKYVQIGITSYINGLAGCGKSVPSVYTRVSAYYDFIMQASGDDGSMCVV